MILGFKTGPKNWEEGQRIVTEEGARMGEVWFDVTKHEAYTDPIAWFRKQKVSLGLHHWGIAEGKYKTNIASSNSNRRKETIRQIKDTIDIGAAIECAYVNMHPGAQYEEMIDLNTFTQQLVDGEYSTPEKTRNLFLEAVEELHEYATKQGVLLTTETLPGAESTTSHDRTQAYNPRNIPLSVMKEIHSFGAFLANDVSHTCSQIAMEDPSKEGMRRGLQTFTEETKEFTRLLHVNTIHSPFNGTDSHDGITDEDFTRDVFPEKEDIRNFLSAFTSRNDVYAVLEPRGGTMQENYRALQKIVEDIS